MTYTATKENHSAFDRPCNVLFVHASDDLYGSDVMLLELVRRLDPTRYRAVVALPIDSLSVGRLSAELRKLSILVVHLNLSVLRRKYLSGVFGVVSYSKSMAKSVRLLRAFMLAEKIDLVHVNTLAVPCAAIAARMERKPAVWHVHELLVSPKVVRIALHKAVQSFATVAVCISEAVKDHLLVDAPKVDARVIPNGIPIRPVPVQRQRELKQEFGVDPEQILIGTAGRISKWKGQSMLAIAAGLLTQRGCEARFVAIGGIFGEDESPRKELLAVLDAQGIADRFKLVDFRADARDLMAAFDIFVLPSVWPEPFGLVVLEAMEAELPVVASAHGGPREVVVDGQTGFLYPPSDPEALCDRLMQLFQNEALRRKMGRLGRERVILEYSIEKHAERMQSLYDELLSVDR